MALQPQPRAASIGPLQTNPEVALQIHAHPQGSRQGMRWPASQLSLQMPVQSVPLQRPMDPVPPEMPHGKRSAPPDQEGHGQSRHRVTAPLQKPGHQYSTASTQHN
jgi:hypothetical protein